jgi:tetratricopeptide (TPR) repeat protein
MRERNAPPPGKTSRPDVREALGLAAACAKRGDLEGAIVHLKEVLRAEPEHEIAHGMLGGIYAELKLPERATSCYERVLALNPRNVLARFHLGLLQLTNRRPQEALETLRPNLSDKTEFLAHFYSGLALLELKRAEEARALLQQAAQRMPTDHQLYPQLQELLRS